TWRSDLETFRERERPVPVLTSDAPTMRRDRLRYPAPPPGTTFFLPSAQSPDKSAREELLDDFYEALTLGVADYYRKTGAFKHIGVALSGGRDSLLTLLVAWGALRKIHSSAVVSASPAPELHAFYMPTRFSSDATRGAAAQIAADVGARFTVLPIEDAFE